jgi:hypothetical protein
MCKLEFPLITVDSDQRGYPRKRFKLEHLCDLRVLRGEKLGLGKTVAPAR